MNETDANATVEVVGGYCAPIDPFDALMCDSCQ